MLHLWPVIEDWQGMRILLPIYTIFEGIKWLITSFLADQAVNLGINWKKPVDPLENHLIPPKNHINSHFFINPFSVWLDWPEMQHLYPYWASFVSNGCSKWLPKYYFLAIWLQTLSGSIQSCQAVTQNGCQTILACPLGSRVQTLSGSVQSCQAATQNGYQNIFPWPLGSKPRNPGPIQTW